MKELDQAGKGQIVRENEPICVHVRVVAWSKEGRGEYKLRVEDLIQVACERSDLRA